LSGGSDEADDAGAGALERYGKTTRRAAFLADTCPQPPQQHQKGFNRIADSRRSERPSFQLRHRAKWSYRRGPIQFRAAALRNRCLSVAKSCSMGLRSSEYFGRRRAWRRPPYGAAYRLPLVAAEIVDDDGVARSQGWYEYPLDVEALPCSGCRFVAASVPNR
jgi:hypothetical protein